MRVLRILVLASLLASLLSSCADLSPLPVPQESRYTFTPWPKNVHMPQHAKTNKTLFISTPVAAPGYRASDMIYVQVPYQLQSFADHRWVAPPATLLLPLLANRLRATGYFKAVVTAPFSGDANYQLKTQLLVLQQEFMTPKSKVRMSIEATLMQGSTGAVIADRVFSTTVSAPRNNPYSGVLAANQAAHVLIGKITAFALSHAR